MTEGDETQSQDSQGSFLGNLQQVVQEICDANGLQTLDSSVLDMSLLENFPIREENVDSQPTSPDSGYTQPPSYGSSVMTTSSDITAGTIVPPSIAQHCPDMYEIEPQRLVFNPPMANALGKHEFQIHFDITEHFAKGANYTHSHLLDKLFVKMNVPCPVKFRCTHPPPEGSCIHAMLVFTNEEQTCIPVCRCANHIGMDKNHHAEHVLQTAILGNSSHNSYYNLKNGRYSVSVPFRELAVGEQYYVILYKFTCLLSCVGGMNRRPVMAIFTLEDRDGNTLGRSCVKVKICSCPGRDRRREEERHKREEECHKRSTASSIVSLPKKRPRVSTDTENESSSFRFLKVRNENFAILSHINDALNLSAMATEEQRERCRQEERNDEIAQILAKFCKENL
ncbi:tumor protein p73-like [Styela clava]